MDIIKLEEEKKQTLCHGCLSSDRRVSVKQDYSVLFFSLLGDQHQLTFNDTKDLTLCWECTAILRHIQTFQNRIRNAQFVLLQSLCNMDHPHTLSTLTHTFKDHYDVTIDEDSDNETETKDELNDLTDQIKLEHVSEDDEIFNIGTKEENNYSDTAYSPELAKIETQTKKHTKKCNDYVNIKRQSIKSYQKHATVSRGDVLDYKNLCQYFSKEYISYGEMESLMVRDRRDRSFERLSYKCYVCKLGYKRRVDFNRHNACNHNESPPYYCTQCKSTRESYNDLIEHWRLHTAMLKCNKCGHMSRSRGELRKHLNREHSTIYSCNSCGGEFGSLREFSNHYKKHHERLICDYCSKTFIAKKSLEIHIKRHHLPAICTICHRTYAHYHALENHHRMYHPHLTRTAGETGGREASYCVECDKQFSSVYRYKRHIAQAAIHTPPKRVRVPCPDCGKLFSRKTYMNNHYRLVHSKDTKFHCELCNKFFARGYGLRIHRKYVHEKMTLPKTKMCDICGRGFGTKRILDNHRRTHTGERPFKCEHCPASFAQQTAMKTHQKTQHKNILKCN